MSNLNTAHRSDLRTLFTFFVPSLIGVFLFMTPVPIGEAMTIPIAVMAKAVQAWIAPFAL
ncbi:MAG: YjiH family protein, partial [Pseudomonadota bacterium]|nr:YjiH family protein [Pseudomonadota bacterium]